MKTLKKTLSLILAVCLIASVFAVAAVSVSANYGDETHAMDVKDAVPAADQAKTFYFYMPEQWRNTYNDAYDGADLASCQAGIYWWDTSYSPKAVYGDTRKDWPGYNISETDPADKNIFVARCPADISTVIFNNTVNAPETADKDLNEENQKCYAAALQTANLTAEYYMPGEDGYGFYPDGTADCNGMIFVCNLKDTEVNEFSGKETYKGAWFYYYGEGKYGTYKTLDEAVAANAVFANGEWPGGEFVPQETTVAPTEAPTQAPTKAPTVTKKANTLKATAKTVTVKAKNLKKKAQTVKAITVKNAKGKVTYKVTKKNSKLTLKKDGKITVKKKTKKGTYKMTVQVKAAGNAQYKAGTKSVKVTIKVK